MNAPFDHRQAAMTLLTSGAVLRPREGQFLGGIAFDANPLTEKQARWLAILLDKHDKDPVRRTAGDAALKGPVATTGHRKPATPEAMAPSTIAFAARCCEMSRIAASAPRKAERPRRPMPITSFPMCWRADDRSNYQPLDAPLTRDLRLAVKEPWCGMLADVPRIALEAGARQGGAN